MSDCMEGDGHKYVPAEAYENMRDELLLSLKRAQEQILALIKERDGLKADNLTLASINKTMSSEVLIYKNERDDLKAKLQVAVEALEKIANHKQTSVDKVYLIHQCEGYQTVARKALDALE